MPIYKSITVDSNTQVLIWKITESEEELSKDILLSENSILRISSMKSEIHRRAYLSVRKLLAIMGYKDTDLIYTKVGKPELKDGKKISITHSFDYAGIIISTNPVGIDIEKKRDKIIRIADKFTSSSEQDYISKSKNQVEILTKIWCIKEAIYKLYGTTGLSFKQNILVYPFDYQDFSANAIVFFSQQKTSCVTEFVFLENFCCVYATIQ